MKIKLKKNGFINKRIMPIARALESHKLKAFLIIYAIWLVDLASTAIALGVFSDVLKESNPVAAMFFDFGLIGWFGWMIVCAGIIIFLLYLPNIFLKFDMWLFGKKMRGERLKANQNTYNLLRLMNVSFVIICESIVIIHNIYLLFGVI